MVQYHHDDGTLAIDPANDRVEDLVNYADSLKARGMDCPRLVSLAMLLQEAFNRPMDEYVEGVPGSAERLNNAGDHADMLISHIDERGFRALFKDDVQSIIVGLKNAGVSDE